MRTQVGSPYVIAGMKEAAAAGGRCVVGFEANGGVLLGSSIEKDGRALKALPTRDAHPAHSVLPDSDHGEQDPPCGNRGQLRLQGGSQRSAQGRTGLSQRPLSLRVLRPTAIMPKACSRSLGHIAGIDNRDGVRISTAAGEIVHFRASGNAPELRCYVEAPTQSRADDLLAWGLDLARTQITES